MCCALLTLSKRCLVFDGSFLSDLLRLLEFIFIFIFQEVRNLNLVCSHEMTENVLNSIMRVTDLKKLLLLDPAVRYCAITPLSYVRLFILVTIN